MDTITHGIAGALVGKGFFGSDADESKNRIAIFALTLGAAFPDVDFIAYGFSSDPMAMIRYHRSLTHSFLALPFFAIVLAWLTQWFARKRGMRSPGLRMLWLIYGVAIASHILLDLCTSYGTQLWYPLSTHRAAWDILFIIDLTFSSILLLPQLIAWICRDPLRARSRAIGSWAFALLCVAVVWRVTIAFGVPLDRFDLLTTVAILSVALLFPPWTRRGFSVSRAKWCRAGTYAALAYIGAAAFAHHGAIRRVNDFAAANKLSNEGYAAIPMPPSLWSWNGLVRARDGVYVSTFDLRDSRAPQFDLVADSPSNSYTAEALQLPAVKTYLWFSRFPVILTKQRDGENLVEFGDARFGIRRERGPGPLTLEVMFDDSGHLEQESWLRIRPLGRVPQPERDAQRGNAR